MLVEKNKIKVVLNAYGSLTVVSVPVKLHKDSYKFTDIECLVPKTTNTTNNSFVQVFGTVINTLGEKTWGTQPHNLPYRKDIVINGFDYEVYSADFPQEFCTVNGSLEITFNYCTMNEDAEAESVLTSGTLNLYIDGNGFNPNGVKYANYDVTAARVNELAKIKVDKVESEEGFVLVSDGEGGMKPSPLPIKEYENQKQYIDELDKAQAEALKEHKDNQENPHNVTTTQLGLENVDNTSDMDKPISTAQQAEFDSLQGQINSLSEIKADKTQVTTEINSAIASVIDSAPETLDTLKEVADWVEEHETDAAAMVSSIAQNASAIEQLTTDKVSWSDLPEGQQLYESTGQNEDGSMTQKAATDTFETKEDANTFKTTTNTNLAAKLDKDQGVSNANKMLGTDASGNVIFTNIIDLGGNVKIYKEIKSNGVVSIIFETPD